MIIPFAKRRDPINGRSNGVPHGTQPVSHVLQVKLVEVATVGVVGSGAVKTFGNGCIKSTQLRSRRGDKYRGRIGVDIAVGTGFSVGTVATVVPEYTDAVLTTGGADWVATG